MFVLVDTYYLPSIHGKIKTYYNNMTKVLSFGSNIEITDWPKKYSVASSRARGGMAFLIVVS